MSKGTAFVFLFSLINVIGLNAQPGALDVSFNTGLGTDRVFALALQQDGKILIAGEFNSVDTFSLKHIARLNQNGSVDTSFHVGAGCSGGRVLAVAVQTDGRILVGGEITSYNNHPVNVVFRLQTDGTLDTTFVTGSGFDSNVATIVIQPDQKILLGGNFTTYNPAKHIIRLYPDGTADTSFHPNGGANGSVATINLQPDGKIFIGGDFIQYDGALVFRAARLNADGTRDTSFHASGDPSIVGVDAVVLDSKLLPSGEILIGGSFNNIALQPKRKVGVLQTNGDLKSLFNHNGTGGDAEVFALETLPNGNFLIGGNFKTFNGDTVWRIAKLDSFGYRDPTFITGSGTDAEIYAVGIQPDGKILIGGNFSTYNGIHLSGIARLYNCLTEKPDSIYGSNYALCSGTNQTYSVTPVAGATKYQWTLPIGWTGSSDSASITATSNGTGGTISVKAFTDSCGYSYAITHVISTVVPPTVPICLVTVDTLSTHNIVIWEKPRTATIDSFFIYRETSTNVYTKIGAVPYDSLSEYHDYGANPNATSYRYKLSVLDTCGAESDKSPYHNTIHLQNLGSGNFQWTFYRIENALNPVLEFNIYRDNLGNGNYTPIGIVPGSNATFTDVTFASADTDALYVLDVNWAISCQPTRQVSTTRSNIRPKGLIDVAVLGLDEVKDAIHIYPNPVSETLFVHLPAGITQLQLINSIGQIVRQSKTASDRDKVVYPIDVSSLPSGVYTLVAETANNHLYKKVIVE